MIPAVDISEYQGVWQNYPADIVLIKMSGGDSGLYMDPDAARNYTDAKASGKHVGGYHFIGWTIGASSEATYFMQAMSPLAENDVYALDIEAIPAGCNPVAYVQQMVDLIHSHINVWPLVYMNVSTLKTYDWSNVLKTCGLWLADWNNNPGGTIPNVPTYVMQQYSDGPNYDHDEWFGTLAEFDAYGWHAPVAAPAPVEQAPTPQPAPVSTPAPKPAPAASTQPTVVTSTPKPEPTPTVITTSQTKNDNPTVIVTKVEPTPPSMNWFSRFIHWLERVLHL